jgi:hypothetical protein
MSHDKDLYRKGIELFKSKKYVHAFKCFNEVAKSTTDEMLRFAAHEAMMQCAWI